MTVLLDSNAFYWLLYEPNILGVSARASLLEADTIVVSMASIWELALKHAKGNFPYDADNLLQGVEELEIDLLAIEADHLRRYADIELPHGDPFDRLLIAQADTEDMLFLTADKLLLASSYATQDARC